MQRKWQIGGKSMKIKVLLATGFVLIVLLCMIMISSNDLYQASVLSGADILLIDAGHGGIDGGAQAADGTPEKDINLDIAICLAEMASRDGWHVVMTRERDELLGSADGGIHSKKTADLKERKRIIDETKPLLAVSIHLNSFKEDKSVHGAQVFYPRGPGNAEQLPSTPGTAVDPYLESKLLAETIQEALTAGLNDGTERGALSKKDIMIFKEVVVPVVLVECGFLSNYDEAQKLKNDNYKQKLAECIYNGIMQYSKKEIKNKVFLKDSLTQNGG